MSEETDEKSDAAFRGAVPATTTPGAVVRLAR